MTRVDKTGRRALCQQLAGFAVFAVMGLGLACSSEGPRALVVADGSGILHAKAVEARIRTYEQRAGRQVRIMVVTADQALKLASRGEADVAVVPMDISLDSFLAPEHGKVAGLFNSGGERLRILEVNEKQHPKVDAEGAKTLASALIATP